jgi:hypothetical protein
MAIGAAAQFFLLIPCPSEIGPRSGTAGRVAPATVFQTVHLRAEI